MAKWRATAQLCCGADKHHSSVIWRGKSMIAASCLEGQSVHYENSREHGAKSQPKNPSEYRFCLTHNATRLYTLVGSVLRRVQGISMRYTPRILSTIIVPLTCQSRTGARFTEKDYTKASEACRRGFVSAFRSICLPSRSEVKSHPILYGRL